jgi:hypothetical protein
LHARYGSSESLPNTEQRNEIYKPIFGRIAGYSPQEEDDFPRLRDDLIHAAAAFAESTAADAAQMLLGSFKDTIRPFQQYLVGLQGDSVKWSRENALPHLTEEVSYTILRSTGIASIFGTGKPPVNEWPYTEDTLGDKLVEAISKQLTWTDKPDEMTLTRDHFSNLQRVGLRGAEAIATIIDFQDGIADNDLKLIIGKVYTWGVALKSLSNQVAPGQPTPAEEKSRLAVHHTELYRAI